MGNNIKNINYKYRNSNFTNMDEFIIDFKVQKGWGFPIALYFFFCGTGAGLFLLSLILFHSPTAILLDLFLLWAGVLILFLDLGNRWKFWKAYKKPFYSWISRGTYLVSLLLIIDLFFIFFEFSQIPKTIVGFLAIIALIAILYPGLVISYSPSISLWNNSFIPFLFGLHSISNSFSISLIINFGMEEQFQKIVPLFIGFLFILIVGTFLFILVSFVSNIGTRESILFLFKGGNWFLFLFLGIIIGMIIPFVLLFELQMGNRSFTMITLLCGFRIIGDIGFRFSILKAGMYEPLIKKII